MENIVKIPHNENRVIEAITIKQNGIKVILIEDSQLTSAFIVCNVNIGSIANKNFYDGCAHMLEHLLFLSDKHRIPNYLQKKVTEYGGKTTNAFTGLFETVYYLDVLNHNLEKIMKIFIDFFTESSLKEEDIKNEMNNVNSEHLKNIRNDGWRQYNLLHSLANKDSNYHIFTTGSNKTLNKPDIREKLAEFYEKYYVSNNFSFCIASNQPMSELKKIAMKYLTKIKNKPANIVKLNKPFYSNNYGKCFVAESVGEMISFNYVFEVDIYATQFNVISYFLNLTDKFSLSDFLKNEGLINSIYTKYEKNIGLFFIDINLIRFSLKDIKLIDGYLKYTINYIFKKDWALLANYYKTLNKFVFNNGEKKNTLNLATEFAHNIHHNKIKDIYIADYIFNKNKPDKLDFDKCIQLLYTNKYKINKPYITEENYGIKYKEIKKINNEAIKYDYRINLDDSFYKIKPIHINNLYETRPIIINKDTYFGNVSLFNESVIYISLIYYYNNFNNPNNFLLFHLSLALLNYHIKKEIGDIPYNYSINSGYLNNFNIDLYLYNNLNKSKEFINTIFNIINSKIIISKNIIDSFILSYKENISNIQNINSWEFSSYILNLFYNNSFSYKILLNEFKNINSKKVTEYLNNLFINNNPTIFIYGNIKKENINDLELFKFNNDYETVIKKNKITFPKEVNLFHKDDNNCINILYHIGKFEPISYLHMSLVELIYSDLFYTQLRTIQLLGYLVAMSFNNIDNNYFIYQKIQSHKSCDYLEDRINKFNKIQKKKLINIDINKWKKVLKLQLETKANNTRELFFNYQSEIINKTFLFDINEILLNNLKHITLTSFIEFCNKFYFNNDNKTIIKINTKNKN